MKFRDAHKQGTYLLGELELGAIYRDALSGYLVLVKKVSVTEYHDPGGKKEVERTVGWYYNPTLGRHAEMELHDHQLISATRETSLMTDTRYQKGYHGHG